MAGFPGFPFSHNTSPSSSSSSSSSSSAPSLGSPPLLGAPSPTSFGSFSSPFGSFKPNGFSFPTPPNSSPSNDDTTINKILEAIEVLENLAKNGAFPHEKLEEIKKELEKKYPNIFSTQKPGKNNNTNNNNNNNPFNTNNSSNTLPNNDPFGWESYYSNILNQQQEFLKNYQVVLQQQVNQQVQAQNQMMEHYMKMYSTSGMFIPNYFGNNFNYPSYNTSAEAWKMAFEMMGKASNDGLFNNVMGNNTDSFGIDGFSALSFLGSLLGGGFGF